MITIPAIILAGTAVLANGPERVKGDILASSPLDLSGEWAGVLIWEGQEWPIQVIEGELRWRNTGWVIWKVRTFVNEGQGKISCKSGIYALLGIYEQVGDRVILCLGDAGNGWPSSFRAGKGYQLFILRRHPGGKARGRFDYPSLPERAAQP